MRAVRIVAVPVVLVLVAAACGRSGGGSAATGASDSSSTSTAPTRAATGDFGTLSEVCGTGSPTTASAQGVTPDAVKIGVFSDAGAQFRPGLNQELFDVATVFSKWCNDRGGISGRQVVIDQHDAGLFNVKARMLEACRDDFYLVGGGAVFDQDGVEPRLQCLLPEIPAYVVSDQARGADLSTPGNPNPLGVMNIGAMRYLDRKFPADTDHVALLTGDVNTTKAVAGQLRDAATKELGWKMVYDDVYPAAGVADWTPYAQKLRDANAKGLIWVGEPESLAKLLGALGDIGYRLDFVRTDANHYDQNLIDTAGPALANAPVYVQTGYQSFEGASPSSPTGQYLAAFDRYLPQGKRRTGLAIAAWSSWLLFAQSARKCGHDLTRRCVYTAAKPVTGWTGGGLHAPTGKPCFAIEQATPRGFARVKDIRPTDGIFNCDPQNVVKVTARR
jgi:hypothetical protein